MRTRTCLPGDLLAGHRAPEEEQEEDSRVSKAYSVRKRIVAILSTTGDRGPA